jgi:signal transduction histidine kinase
VTSRLTIRSKLAAALAVPLVALATLVAVQVRDSVGVTDAAKVQADLATSSTGPGGIVTAIQNERNFEALRSIGFHTAVELPVTTPEEARAATDEALNGFRDGLADLEPGAADVYLPAVSAIEGGIDDLRSTADTLGQTPSLEQAVQASALFGNYTALLGELLDANEQVSITIDDADLRTGVELLDSISRQAEIEARLVREALVSGVLQDADAAIETRKLVGSRIANERRVRNLAVGDYAAPVMAVLDHPDRAPYVVALDSTANDPLATEIGPMLDSTPEAPAAQLRAGQESGANIVDARAAWLRDDATTKQRNYLLAAVGAVALALFVLALANRWITKPLSRLANEARVMASERLPNAVNSILDTPLGDDVVPPTIEPVRVRGGAEVAGAVEALNAVQESAIGLAVEQVVLRRNIADSFVNLGRRNQNLLSRQLDLITHLEQEESDSEELEQLFQLDHLATRMRRNAESLLVLAGEEPARQWSAPVPVADVLRAALGEVEQYSRVRLDAVDETTIAGRAVADVSHIIAELVENALTFSPPDSSVNIVGRHSDDGYTIDIVDTGIGMSEEDIERSNVRLRASESFTVAPSRYLGHYVVAQLALRHEILVSLDSPPEGGVTASIVLPFVLLDDGRDGPIDQIPEIDAFSFGDIALPDELAVVADAPEPVAGGEPPLAVSASDADEDPIDVPDFIAGADFMIEPDPSPEPVPDVVPAASELPPDVSAPVPPVVPVASLPETEAPEFVPTTFADAAAAVAPAPPEEVVAAPVADTPSEPVAPAAPAPDRGVFAAMLHATAAPAATAPKEAEAEPLVEPAAPRPEPVEAFVSNRTDGAVEADSAAPELTFVAAPIQDDLLPQLPRRGGRRSRGAEPAAPVVPAQVLRIAATVSPAEPVAEPATIVAAEREPHPAAASAAAAPPLPRRELDADAVAPPPRAAVPAMPEEHGDRPRPNYELFAAFRAATDQGRADAVRGSDGGGA